MKKEAWDILTLILEKPLNERIPFLEQLDNVDEQLISEITLLLSNADEANNWWEVNEDFNAHLLIDATKQLEEQFPLEEKILGKTFGAYKIIDTIGAGGMGKVYVAERADGAFYRKVAIKFMALTLNPGILKERFLQEQKILGSLNHSGIAQLYDASISKDGTPYLIMEFVKGEDLISYARDKKLDTQQKLELFLRVCDGIDFAHKNLVVHRDLKPSNIIVTKDGDPKILDFGISKWMEDLPSNSSQFDEQKVYSLKYSSPEQIEHSAINTTTDIYSLGVLLFELLGNEHPFKLDGLCKKEAIEKVTSGEIPALSELTLNRNFLGDLDAIVSKAIDKNPINRYQNVRSLSEDILNYIHHFPVDARANNIGINVGKFVQRNKVSTIIATLSLVSLIILGAIFTSQIKTERDKAEVEAQKATVTKNYLLNLFNAADPLSKQGEKQTLEDFLNKSIKSLSNLDDEPEVKEEASYTLALVSYNLGAYSQAESLFVESYSLNKALNNGITIQQMNILDWIGDIYAKLGNYQVSKIYFDSALVLKKDSELVEELEIAESYSNLGLSLAHLGKLDSAEVLINKAMDMYSSSTEFTYNRLINNIEIIADLSREQKDYEQSAWLLEENIVLRKTHFSKDKQGLALSYNNLGFSYRNLEKYALAEDAYLKSLELLEIVLGRTHPTTLTLLSNLAGVLSLQGKLAEAEAKLMDRLDRTKEQYGELDWRSGQAYTGLGSHYFINSMYEKSVQNYQAAANIFEVALGENHFWTNRAKLNAAFAITLSEESEKGKDLFISKLADIQEHIDDRLTYYNYLSLARIQEQLNEFELTEMELALTHFLNWHNATYPN